MTNKIFLEYTSENIIKKYRKYTETRGIAESFGYIKSLSTYELVGVSENGKERVLLNDMIKEYGEDIVHNNDGYRYLIPPIPEGVIKSRTKDNTIYYTHFKVVNKTETSFGLEMKEYHFFDGNFYLRYIISLNDITNTIDADISKEVTVEYACVKQFLLNTVGEEELKKEFTTSEVEWIKEMSLKDDSNLDRTVNIIIRYVLSTFQAINFANNYIKKKDIRNNNSGKTVVIKQEENYVGKNNERIIDIKNYLNYKQGSKKHESTVKEERVIVRKTDKWIVSGHLRQYKNGKVVYIEPYYKGPKRETEVIPKTTFKITNVNYGND